MVGVGDLMLLRFSHKMDRERLRLDVIINLILLHSVLRANAWCMSGTPKGYINRLGRHIAEGPPHLRLHFRL